MHGTRASAVSLASSIHQAAREIPDIEIAVFPASLHLQAVSEVLKEGPVAFGAQNFYPEPAGAFTGEISAPQISEFGCRYVLVGHSERRHIFGETDALVARKCVTAVTAGLRPVLCVGETREEREKGQTEQVIRDQLAAVVDEAGVASLASAVIAYEPVWAIGTGLTATPEQAQEVHAFIRSWLAPLDAVIAQTVQILYGGSVKSTNAAAIFAMPDVDGALVGGASLLSQEFLAICHAAR